MHVKTYECLRSEKYYIIDESGVSLCLFQMMSLEIHDSEMIKLV